MINNKELKIIATIGPSSLNKKTISKMDQSGVDIFRINLSHTELKDFEKIIKKVRKWTLKPVCPDTEGAQIRTGIIKNSEGINLIFPPIVDPIKEIYNIEPFLILVIVSPALSFSCENILMTFLCFFMVSLTKLISSVAFLIISFI